MEYGICDLAIVPLRAEPSDRSELVSQVLFGEAFEITEWKEKWVKIVTDTDKYTGWIDRLQFTMLDHTAYNRLLQTPAALTYKPVTQARKIIDNSIIYLPAGSSLVFLEGNTSYIGNQKFEIISETGETDHITNIAKSYLNVPYLWGGRTHFGIDCSGFTQMVYKLMNISLRRDASLQAEDGTLVDGLAEVKLGDLAFFGAEEGRITHVGIMLNSGQIIHASGKVKIDTIDDEGIHSEELKRYTHKLRLIKRYY
jgi:cell wall-associated NlpC family hydrolase